MSLVDTNYSLLDRLLHRLALGFTPVADLSFHTDQATVRTDPAEIVDRKHVFVCGLARAGTTVLMRRLHATRRYWSLTYRDMPFVLAPNLWRQLSLLSHREVKTAQRAHGDNVLVDADSPECFDEVFWRIFAGHEYLASAWLQPHSPDRELVSRYVCYVNAILSTADSRQCCYLSKNNNNILRLRAIRGAFPRSLILIPFRLPLQHAFSLLRQHLRFSAMQTQQKFVLAYMTWLGHHEFGLGHRPFRFDAAHRFRYAPDTLNYWLDLWCETYSWLEQSSPADALFVCYEDLCNHALTWNRLAERVGIPADDGGGEPFKYSERPLGTSFDGRLANRAAAIYVRLAERAHDLLLSGA